ncbi:hypothetical protein GOP47_0021210 [Adiantum capillus-veneris]|uniref:Uncharacterized protein n=1 Tax=Adiantum capillus-veneris TaxID=13818 RepID=A0A9D4Z897_ADICA|nr:hypothetical protein GOP47_0021210 [Adiantum capillus-veneris]
MDADLWAARLSAAKRHHALQTQWDHLSADDFEVDDEARPEFSCPYCYEDFDISSLCTHLEDEHMFESRGVVCPVCAAKVPKDMVGHMTIHHGHLFKVQRRRRFRRSGVPSGATLSLLGKEYREAHLQAILGSGAFRASGSSASNSTADSLLSALAYSLPMIETDDVSKQQPFVDENLNKSSVSSLKPSKPKLEIPLSAEEREQKLKQATLRASFARQLVLSTILKDS